MSLYKTFLVNHQNQYTDTLTQPLTDILGSGSIYRCARVSDSQYKVRAVHADPPTHVSSLLFYAIHVFYKENSMVILGRHDVYCMRLYDGCRDGLSSISFSGEVCFHTPRVCMKGTFSCQAPG